eukprot:Em0018g1161a
MSNLGDVKLRDLGEYTLKNFRLGSIPSYASRAVASYRAKYVTCKNARLTPFLHLAGVCMVLNYMIHYKHLKHDRIRKYH